MSDSLGLSEDMAPPNSSGLSSISLLKLNQPDMPNNVGTGYIRVSATGWLYIHIDISWLFFFYIIAAQQPQNRNLKSKKYLFNGNSRFLKKNKKHEVPYFGPYVLGRFPHTALTKRFYRCQVPPIFIGPSHRDGRRGFTLGPRKSLRRLPAGLLAMG